MAAVSCVIAVRLNSLRDQDVTLAVFADRASEPETFLE